MDSDIITAGRQQYRVAGWPQRVVARGLDVVLVVFACAMPGEIFGVLQVPAGLIYLILGSGLMKGASLGKRAMGLKVIESRHGGPCGVMQDFLRQRYFLYGNPMMLVFMVYDSVTDRLYQPETCVVLSTPLTAAETEVPPEKPAKLDLAGMGETLRKMREARDLAAPRDE